jgi:hypothetical protein
LGNQSDFSPSERSRICIFLPLEANASSAGTVGRQKTEYSCQQEAFARATGPGHKVNRARTDQERNSFESGDLLAMQAVFIAAE